MILRAETSDAPGPDPELLEAVSRFGDDAVSFETLESGLSVWRDEPQPAGTGAVVAYADTGSGWVAAGAPLAPAAERSRAAERFVAAARAAGRRACFFATEAPEQLGQVATLFLGEQPLFEPAGWIAGLASRRRLRSSCAAPAPRACGCGRSRPRSCRLAVGPGATPGQILFRALQTAAPIVGTAALLWSARRAAVLARLAQR